MQQQSSMMLFCDECGLANEPGATHCVACRHSLAHASSTPPVTPVKIAPPPVLQVTPGPLLTQNSLAGLLSTQRTTGDFKPGTILAGRYQIEEEIGRGGFSIVYRATDLYANHREVAIKRIQLTSLTPRQIIDATETFNREITMLARFKGVDGIPAFYEHLTDADNWYLITQYIKGQTLEEYLQQKPGGYLDEKETVTLGIVLTQIMQKLHDYNPPVIFRDLKPANIMITPEHTFFLIDFGIARNFTPGKAKDTTPLGSPGYAPPEQYGRAQTDQRADIYSLGATLQTLFTGRDPLELRAGEPSRNPRQPSRTLSKLFAEMLSPDVAKRPASMRVVQRRLESTRRSPRLSYMTGLLFGFVLSAMLALLIFTELGRVLGSFAWILISMINSFRKRLQTRFSGGKLSWPFLLLGMLTFLLPFALLWLWHMFGWPF
jgi:serine/threonine protein kinase